MASLAELQIAVRAEIAEAQARLNAISKTIKATGDATKASADKTKYWSKAWGDFKSQVPGLDKALNLITNPITLVSAGIVAIGKAMADSVKETYDYALQVEDLSRKLGTTTEEASKLIQVADDLRVEVSTLETSFRYALKNGITPNVEGLIALSTEYQKLRSPTDKAAFAMDKFGKAGLEMQKILEQTPEKLREMVKELEGSALVMSEENVQAAKDYYAAMDTMNDSLLELKITVGNVAIPFLERLTRATNDATKAALNHEKATKVFETFLRTYLPNLYILIDGMTELNNISHATPSNIHAMGNAMGIAAEQTEEMRKAAEDAAKALQNELNFQLKELNNLVNGSLGPSIDDFNEKQGDLTTEAVAVRDEIAKLEGMKYLTDAQREELDANKGKLGEIESQIKKNADEHDIATKRILLDILTQRAAMDGLTKDEVAFITTVAETWGLIDDRTAAATKAADESLTMLANGEGLAATIENFTIAAGIAGSLSGTLNALDGASYNTSMTVTTYHVDVQKPGGGVNIKGGQFSTNAKGTDYIVPSGYGNESWNIGTASSGERVTVTPKNQVTNNNNMTAPFDYRRLGKEIGRAVRDAVQLSQ